MPTSQSQLTAILKEQIKSLEERCPGYRSKVAETLASVIIFENQNKIKPRAIRQDVKKECLALGDFLAEGVRRATEEQTSTPESKA